MRSIFVKPPRSVPEILRSEISRSGLQAATTFDELQSELDKADNGATVYVENDISYTGVLAPNLAKRITLASPPGQTNVLLRASNYA